jgi:phosphoribosylanthranilate isomerase
VNVTFSPKIKFCGITSVEDAERGVAAGAWAIGLIFWPGSPRRCTLDAATEIAAALKRRVEVVGVFLNPTLAEVARTADAVGLTMVQLHGEEGPLFCAEVARRTGCKVIKAARVRSGADIQALEPFRTDYHLLDSYTPGKPGGTGETFAWKLALDHRRSVPVILSGGLKPETVGGAIAVVRPFGVDVASGVELEPGRKDPDKLQAFAEAVRATAATSAIGAIEPQTSGR